MLAWLFGWVGVGGDQPKPSRQLVQKRAMQTDRKAAMLRNDNGHTPKCMSLGQWALTLVMVHTHTHTQGCRVNQELYALAITMHVTYK